MDSLCVPVSWFRSCAQISQYVIPDPKGMQFTAEDSGQGTGSLLTRPEVSSNVSLSPGVYISDSLLLSSSLPPLFLLPPPYPFHFPLPFSPPLPFPALPLPFLPTLVEFLVPVAIMTFV